MDEFTDLERVVLLEAVASLHALFQPCRFDRTPRARWAALWSRRWSYDTLGLPLVTRSRAAAAAVADLARRGLVRRAKGAVKTSGLALTAAGLDEGERLAGFAADESFVFCQELARHGPGWVLETALAAPNPDTLELEAVATTALPALCRGLVACGSTVRGNLGYQLLRMPEEPAAPGESDHPPDEYFAAYAQASAWLASAAARVDEREIGAVPLSPSVFSEKVQS